MNPSNNLDYEPLGRLNYLLRRTLDIKERVEYFRRYGHGFSKGAEKLAKWSISYCDAIVSGLSDKYFRRKLLKTELRVERIHKGLEELGRLLRYFETASDKETPAVLIGHLEKLLKEITPEDTLIVRPHNIYNYKAKMLGNQLKSILDRLPPALGSSLETPSSESQLKRGDILVIGYPKYETVNDLVNSLIGHEVGHYIYDRLFKGKQKTLIEFLRSQQEHKGILKKLKDDNKERPDEFKNYRIERLALNWFKESFCDWFGFKFLGPSFYFALLEQNQCRADYYKTVSLSEFPDEEKLPDHPSSFNPFFAYLPPIIRVYLLFHLYEKCIFTRSLSENSLIPAKKLR